jgi:hypothetical protein
MGAGVLGQTVELIRDDPGTALTCYGCHAPLTEQQEMVGVAGGRGGRRFVRNRLFVESLQARGLTCAACHLRRHQRFGPPRRDGSLGSNLPASDLAHGGAIRTPAFEQAEFCKGCHQFGPDGYALNGKLLENTYHEWRASRYGGDGKTCQGCHMPDRRHLWRGIHDPETVRQGVTIALVLDQERYRVGDRMAATISLANTGVGHAFPTYVTPKVLVRFELLDREGKPVPGGVHEERIGREVTLDLATELFDTRIAPGEVRAVSFARSIDRQGLRLRVSVVVAPDDFYAQFFEAIVRTARTRRARSLLQQALDRVRRSAFTIFREERTLS